MPITIHSWGIDEISQKFDICLFSSDFLPTFVILIIEIAVFSITKFIIIMIMMIDSNRIFIPILNNDVTELINSIINVVTSFLKK